MSAGEQPGAGNVIEDEAVRGGLAEQHHVAIIPESERHGRPRDQFTLWFAANANVVNFTLGVLAIEFGLNLFWALVGIVAGNVLGMLLTALHAWQGPKLGVPQMIQGRGQFGFYGASFILIVSIVLDIGYLAASQVLPGDSLHLLASGLSVQVWIILVTIPALALAIFGVLLFFFVPWSAINLVDYYLVRRGRYDVQSFFTRRRLRRVPVVGVPVLRDHARGAGAVH